MGPTYQVVLSKGAQFDFRRIYDYLLDNVSYDIAEHVRKELLNQIAQLSQSPESYGLLTGHNSETTYRRALKWQYRIIFSIDESLQRVEVVRIDSSKMDPAGLKNLP